MRETRTADLIHSLQEEITRVISPLITKAGKFALLDFPNYANVGDSAIWLGEITFFRDIFNANPSYVSYIDCHSSADLRKAVPKGPVLLSGGGNFGDLWPHHQQFRETILREFPDRPVIQLPQSLHFGSREALENAAAIINAHPDFTLLVRDRRSLAIAQKSFTCKTHLCPDMAFCLGAVPKPMQPSRPVLLMLRSDKESRGHAGADTAALSGFPIEDWLAEDADIYARTRARTARELIPILRLHAFNRWRRRELFYRRMAENRVARGVKQLSSAECVATDRLHVHILCLLLGIPHVILDNTYGKIGGFAEAWTKDSPLVRRAETLKQAVTGMDA